MISWGITRGHFRINFSPFTRTTPRHVNIHNDAAVLDKPSAQQSLQKGITGYGKMGWSTGNFRMMCLGSGTDPHEACCCGYITCGLGLLHPADPRGDGSIMGAELGAESVGVAMVGVPPEFQGVEEN